MKRPTTKAHIDETLARKWGVTPRSIRTWRKSGAPLQDDKATRAWLASRRTMPPMGGVIPAPSQPTAKDTKREPAPVSGLEGLRGSIARLSKAELDAQSDYTQARSLGDPSAIRLAHRRWLEISEALRRAHVSLSESEREAQEFVPRSAVESVAYRLGQAMNAAGRAVAECLVNAIRLDPRPENVAKIWTDAYQTRLGTALASLLSGDASPWLLDALFEGAGTTQTALGPMAQAITTLVSMADEQQVTQGLTHGSDEMTNSVETA